MRVKVRCLAPKYARGEYEFHGFEEVFNWLVKIRGLLRGDVGSHLYMLAKDGRVGRALTTRYDMEIQSNFYDYFLASEVARRVGLLSRKMGTLEDVINPNLNVALSFAKALDEEVLKRGS